jgi:luciferase family oxidoreductase, group 1
MSEPQRTRYSLLDLAPVRAGGTLAEAFRNTADLARHAEQWGYTRFWLAEHHNMAGIGSAATSVLIGHVAGQTSTLRVGSGGIMLPNHSSLVIAEQFGTLETLYPGRIDLGVGRAPGTDGVTARALGRNLQSAEDEFPRQVQELLTYLELPLRASACVRFQARAPMYRSGCLGPALTVHSLPQRWACASPSPATSRRS